MDNINNFNNSININNILEQFKQYYEYYYKIFSIYGTEKSIIQTLTPLKINEQKDLYNHLHNDSDFLGFFIQEIDKKYGNLGLSHFYNAIYYNLIDFLQLTLDVPGLIIEWEEKNIQQDYCPIKIYYNNTYYGDIDVFNREYSMADNQNLISIIEEVNSLEKDYNQDNETINNLYLKISKNRNKKSIIQKLGIAQIDLSKEDKKEYDALMDKKYNAKLKIDNLYKKYNDELESLTKDRTLDEELNKKLHKELGLEIFITDKFPTIETYNPNTNIDENIQYTDIDDKFKYN